MEIGVSAGLFYALVAFGSVSLGYFVLRTTIAEVRTLPAGQKVFVSFAVGLIINLAAWLLDIELNGWPAVAAMQGYMLPLVLLGTTLVFLAVRLYVWFFPPEFLTVGVPLPLHPPLPPDEGKTSTARRRR